MALVDQRKTTLYRALDILASEQADYLSSGDPGRRRPLTQRALADRLDVLAGERPRLSDEGLRRELERRCGARLSRRSIAQYRLELGLGRRSAAPSPAAGR